MKQKKKRQRKSKDGLVSSVLKISPKLVLEDEQGKYIPYCDYRWHKGIIKDISVCETRECRHYHKYRIESKKRNNFNNSIEEGAKKYYDKFF